MRDAERIDNDIAHLERRSRAENTAIKWGLELLVNRLFGQAIAINRDTQLGSQGRESLRVIGMFVSDEYSVQAFHGASDLRQPLPDLASAQPGINEETGLIGFKVSAIAAGAAAQNR